MKNKTILVTGATGSLGQTLVKRLLKMAPKKLICFSRDEYKQVEMQRSIRDPDKKVRYFLGDIRFRERLYRAFNDVDYVINVAALKHVDKGERDPYEFVMTNVIAVQNIIDAAIDCGVKKVLGVSSDKAVNPVNLYGATKLCGDKLLLAAESYAGNNNTKFSVIRFGNFIGSRGSVIPYWQDLVSEGERCLPLTDFEMTRFFIPLEDAASRCIEALKEMGGGEIFVPKMETKAMIQWCKEINPEGAYKIIGLRPGEKLHEDLILPHDACNTMEWERFYVTNTGRGKKVKDGFAYGSNSTND